MTQTGIRIDGVTKAYKNGPRAVDDVSLEVRQGEFMVLVGPSGCGKSTLLKLIAGIEETTAGVDPHRRPRRHAPGPAQARHRDGLPELRALPAPERAREPRLRPQAAQDVQGARSPSASTRWRRSSGLEEMLERKPGELSGGQRQRVAMGRAIVREPQAFLMDEPLSNLDAKLRVSMRAQLSRLHERLGVTTVYVTHDQVEAMTLGQRVAVMRGGVLQQCDTPEMLFEHPANLFVAAFIGSPAMNLVEATVSTTARRASAPAGCRSRPARRCAATIVLGIRPHDLKLGDVRHRRPRAGGRAARDRDPRRRGHRRAAAALAARSLRPSTPPPTTTSCWPRTTAPRSRS